MTASQQREHAAKVAFLSSAFTGPKVKARVESLKVNLLMHNAVHSAGTTRETCDHLNFSLGCFPFTRMRTHNRHHPSIIARLRADAVYAVRHGAIMRRESGGRCTRVVNTRVGVSCLKAVRLACHMSACSTGTFPRRLASSRRQRPGLVVFQKHFGVGQQNINAQKRCGTAFPSLSIQFSFRYFRSKASQNTTQG
ncbi:Hypothetical_protein [Hexamita inflata]|uniref:Hypothetical_protein n=1 Tax=Hexamita inflata TaxID=28002 RepID=A0AA86QM11_9EUKA|nr:Hypothetical protein HINF_LOCUS49714 [Hexamita inflata]CAI9962072.1 Hypothetical protein HINF_LOCUS49717 [Hexamita inflata]